MPYELRIYSANLGKIDAPCARFRDHTVGLFQKHGIESIGYWIEDASPDVLTYVIRHVGEPAKNWEAFLNDPVWIKVEKASEVAGPLMKSIESRNISGCIGTLISYPYGVNGRAAIDAWCTGGIAGACTPRVAGQATYLVGDIGEASADPAAAGELHHA